MIDEQPRRVRASSIIWFTVIAAVLVGAAFLFTGARHGGVIVAGHRLAAFERRHAAHRSDGAASDSTSGKGKINENAIILLYPDSTRCTLADFMNGDSAVEKGSLMTADMLREHRHYTFSDLDRDGVPELLTEYYTWGNHCCTVYDLFTWIAENVYGCIFSASAVYAEIVGDRLEVSFHEQLGYFFTCYACDIDDKLPKGSIEAHASLVYRDGTLDYAAKDPKLDKRIVANLEFLRKRGVPDLDETEFDDGTRKAYAHHLAAYYFNNREDLGKTHALFRKYYAAGDSLQVWQEFDEDLANIWNMDNLIESFGKSVERLIKLYRSANDSLPDEPEQIDDTLQ